MMFASSQNQVTLRVMLCTEGMSMWPADFGKNARSTILSFPALRECFLLCFSTDVANGSYRRDFSKLMFLLPAIANHVCDGIHIIRVF